MYLSKSKYCQLWRCNKLLWLDTYCKDLRTPDLAAEARMITGKEVGVLARGLFGDFTEIKALKDDGTPDFPGMVDATSECISCGTEIICEAAFSYEGLYCAVDILRKESGGYAIYEVKSTTDKEEPDDQYAADLAYQKYVLEHCGVKVTGTYLVLLNNEYVRGEELDIQALFITKDIREMVDFEISLISFYLDLGDKTMSSVTEPYCRLNESCLKPKECPYWEYCSKHLPTPSVFDLYRLSGKKKLAYYEKGLVSFEVLLAVPELNEKQLRQIQFQLSDCDDYIDKDSIRDFLNELSYPIYFLDFETMQLAVPQFPGTKPYAQIPFQYSLHYIEEPGGELKHKEFLAESGTNPLRDIAESLCRDIPMNVCVTAYYKGFECTRLKELATLFPDLAEHLLNIRENVHDLLVPFQSGYYYNRAMGGSFSIKSVLPALFPDDPALNYHNLEGVHNGTEAMTIFPKIKDMPPDEQTAARKNLLAYCKLDTYAMVKVWEALKRAAE